jgi:uncharacterized membrane protein YhaH (DUF805 family)
MENINQARAKSKAPSSAKWGVVGAIAAILIITVLEFPAPVGFETRPQTDVSLFWLFFFLAIVVTLITTIALIFKHPAAASRFGIAAGILNILQVIADQAHLMQPEVAPLGYSILEGLAVVASIVLIYFSVKAQKES